MNPSESLQRLLYTTIRNTTEISTLANGPFDKVPPDPWKDKDTYITIEPPDYTTTDAVEIVGEEHTLQIDVWSRETSFLECKRVADLVKRALHKTSLTMTDSLLVDCWVRSVQFLREEDTTINHAVILVEAIVEEV